MKKLFAPPVAEILILTLLIIVGLGIAMPFTRRAIPDFQESNDFNTMTQAEKDALLHEMNAERERNKWVW